VIAGVAALALGLTNSYVVVAYLVASGVWAPLGLLVWRRRPEHPIGPLMYLVGLLNLSVIPGFVMGALLVQFEATIPQIPWAMMTTTALAGAYSYVFLLPILLFPEGRPSAGLQRGLTWVLVFAAIVATASGFLAEPLGPVTHPFASPAMADTARSVYDAMTQAYGFALVVVIVVKVFQYRRSESLRRTQLKWLMYVLSVYLVSTVIAFGVVGVQNFEANGLVVDALFVALIPTAMALAILRYRLYEIDRLVSRTVTYALVAIVVAAIFAIPVILIPSLMGQTSDLVIAGATLLAAAAFTPIRNRIQVRVDRRFNRARYDTAREIDDLARRLNEAPDAEAPVEETIDLVSRTLQPATIGFWAKG
jgi:hypothetical protein